MKIYYLRDPSGGIETFLNYKETIEKFIHRGTKAHGLNFEKLRVSEKSAIYSIRVNDACRILLMKYKGQYCLVDVVEHHDYEKSRFIKNPALFQRLLAGSGEAVELPPLEAFIDAEAFAGASTAADGSMKQWRWERAEDDVEDLSAPGSLDLMSSSPLEYQGQFITLNAEQEGVVSHPRLPVIVSGPAGSGKSSVALSMLSQYLREHRVAGEWFPVLYVCESQKLVEEMRKLWQAMLGADAGELSSLVEFKTYDEMVAEQLHVDAARLLGKDAFFAWYKSAKRPKDFVEPDETVWQECRIRSGYTSDADYLSLGGRQSSFKREEGAKRAVVCHLYKTFLQYAQVHGLHAPALEDLRSRITKAYKLIAADEAQDLSFAQLLFLYRLSGGAIAFFLGDNQLLNDNLSRLPFLREVFLRNGGNPENVVTLGLTYRCSEAVTVLANALTRIKYELTGGAADSLARLLKVADPTLGKGTASLFELKDKTEIERFAHLASSSRDVFVVTQAAFVDEAQGIFRTGQVFTPEQVKGLGARVVILWRLLDCDMAREAARVVLIDESSDELRVGHRAKAGVGDSRYESFGNALIVAATRAIEHVVMFEKIKHDMKPIRVRLAKALETTQSRGPGLAVAESTAVDWEEQAFDLYSRGYREQALGIFVQSLKGRLEDFDTFIAAQRRKIEGGAADVAAIESMAGGVAVATMVDVGLRNVTDVGASAVGEPMAVSSVGVVSDAQVRHLIEGLSKTDSKGKDTLLADKENLTLLRHMNQALFKKIPLQVWLSWVGKKKNLRPLLLDLVSDAEHGPLLLQRLLACGLTIPSTIWEFRADREHGVCPGESIPYWLLVHPEGQAIFTQLSGIYDISKIITTDFLITAPPGRPGLSPLAMLIAFEPGLKLLKDVAKRLARVFQAIPVEFWSSPHPLMRSENGGNLSLINTFQSNPNGLKIFLSICQAIADSCFSGREAGKAALFLTELQSRALGDPCLAATNGDIETLRTAHELAVDLSQCKDERGHTLAMLAAQHGQLGVIRELHRLKVPFDDMKGVGAACSAIMYGKMDVLLALHEYEVPFSSDDQEILAVDLFAAEQGSVPALTVLSQQCGVDLDRDSVCGGAAYHAAKNGHLPALKTIYSFCPDINSMGLLFLAASWGRCNIAKFLISKIEDINRPCIMTDKQLIRYFSGSMEAGMLVSHLVSMGQNASALNVRAIDIADAYGHTTIAGALLEKKMSQQGHAFAASGRALDDVPVAEFASTSAALPRVATALSQLGVLATGAGSASLSTVSQGSSDDFRSLEDSAGSFSAASPVNGY